MTEKLKIGEFTIERLPNGKFWVEVEGGESMEVFEAELIRMLREFWEKRF
jgi:hypothetical protein